MQKPTKPNKRRIIATLMLLVLIGSLVGCSGGDKKKPPTDLGEGVYSIGDTVEGNGLKVTINDATNLDGDGAFSTLAAGHQFLKVGITIQNTTSNEVSLLAMRDFEAMVDGESVTENLFGHLETDFLVTLDGTLAPGDQIEGSLIYEVSKKWKQLEIDVPLVATQDKPVSILIVNN